eukprot:311788-Chlamydomonas_euryale.AAC.1
MSEALQRGRPRTFAWCRSFTAPTTGKLGGLACHNLAKAIMCAQTQACARTMQAKSALTVLDGPGKLRAR